MSNKRKANSSGKGGSQKKKVRNFLPCNYSDFGD